MPDNKEEQTPELIAGKLLAKMKSRNASQEILYEQNDVYKTILEAVSSSAYRNDIRNETSTSEYKKEIERMKYELHIFKENNESQKYIIDQLREVKDRMQKELQEAKEKGVKGEG